MVAFDAPWVKKALWLILALEGCLAVWISAPWMTADSVEYLKLANALGHGQYGSLTTEGFRPDVLRPPGYPILLHFFINLLGLPLWAISAIQVAAYYVALFLVARMLERFTVPSAPMLALAVIYPFPTMYSANIMTEAWAALVVTSIAALLVLRPAKRLVSLAVGILAGAATLIRADLVLLTVLAAALILLAARTINGAESTNWRGAGISLLGSFLVVAPYMAWNYVHFGQAKPIPLAGALGNSLYIASWQPLLPRDDLDALDRGVFTPNAEAVGLGKEVRSMNRAIGAPPNTAPWNPVAYPTRATQIASTKHTLHLAIHRIKDDPFSYSSHVIKNTWRLWNTAVYPTRIPGFIIALLALSSGLIFLLGFAGVLMCIVRPPAWPIPLWLTALFLYVPAVHVFLHTEARYTAPARPLLLLFAAAFCFWLFDRIASRTRKGRPAIRT